jgi:hypothetical protein
MIVGLVVVVPFLARPVCLPVLFRLHIPKASASKPDQARALVDLLARALPGRTIHVVADAAYRGPAWQGLPQMVTFTTRLAANAVLYAPEPPRTGKRGHPAWKGARLGTAAQIAARVPWSRTRVTRYGVTEEVDLAVVCCLWWGSLHRTPIRLVLVRDLDETKAYTLALATADLTTPGEQIVARYADRWSIEQSIKDGKQLLGAGEAHNRLPAAVERTTPLGLANLTILILWYDHAGHPTTDLASRRRGAPWYRHKRHVSIDDMIIAFRRARITDITAAQNTPALSGGTTPTSQATAA